jgi:glucose/arabinose dehydrogenase
VFVDQLVFPMGLAWRDGQLYVCDPPEVVAFEDRNGQAGPREVVLGSFGHTDNGSLHGLDFGPDGLLYGTLGSPERISCGRTPRDRQRVYNAPPSAHRLGLNPHALAHGVLSYLS